MGRLAWLAMAPFPVSLFAQAQVANCSIFPTRNIWNVPIDKSTGGDAFTWPPNVQGGMQVGTLPGTCSAQTSVSDGSKLYATIRAWRICK